MKATLTEKSPAREPLHNVVQPPAARLFKTVVTRNVQANIRFNHSASPLQGPAVPHLTPMQALRRLGTMTGLPMNGATKHDDALIQKVVASVKRMQVEREALKWRCRDLGHQVLFRLLAPVSRNVLDA